MVIVVGNGVAGYACARELALAGVPVALVGRGAVVDRPPLSKQTVVDGRLRLLADADRLTAEGIQLVDAWAVAVDPDSRRVELDDGRTLTGDDLVIATGLDYTPPALPGIEAALVTAYPADCARAAREFADGIRRVVVIGAGLVGCETAATLGRAGHQVVVVDQAALPAPALPAEFQAVAADALRESGVRFVGSARVAAVRSAPDGSVVELDGAPSESAELVIAAVGGRPVRLPGLDRLGPAPVAVDARMRAGGVYVIGDLASPVHQHFGRMRSPHWDTALRGAEVAARAILGAPAGWSKPPYWWSDLGQHRIAEFGNPEAVAEWDVTDPEMRVGRDAAGMVVCTRVIDAPRRVREARGVVEDALQSLA
jgi:NADPH-dependent 2,4-dienoyl-CoA reductase/sulfur reductase-like enzyme